MSVSNSVISRLKSVAEGGNALQKQARGRGMNTTPLKGRYATFEVKGAKVLLLARCCKPYNQYRTLRAIDGPLQSKPFIRVQKVYPSYLNPTERAWNQLLADLTCIRCPHGHDDSKTTSFEYCAVRRSVGGEPNAHKFSIVQVLMNYGVSGACDNINLLMDLVHGDSAVVQD
ncbi:hypothetical protein TNCV_3467061 [Trichonephila clavipes]|nr:hypothetical protein TNCV_3467061 [Trichonephila clavipes]